MSVNLYEMFFRPSKELKRQLKIARMNKDPDKFVHDNIRVSLMMSVGLTIVFFFLFSTPSSPNPWPLLGFPILFFLMYAFLMNTPVVYIRRRERDIDRDILFATRYLLVRMESGAPLFNAMADASKHSGVGGKYFKEIVDEINLGKPIEDALEYAHDYSSSHQFQLVLRQILNSIKTGVDVSESLRKLIDELTKHQQIEIKAYSKKLNSIVLFYLIIACVVPSLGIAMFLVMASMMNLNLNLTNLVMILFFLSLLQMFFIVVVRSVRPMVDV